MEIDTRYPPTIPIYLNDQGPYTFVLDTGCTDTNLSRTVAENLSLAVDDLGCSVLDAFAVGDLVLPDYQIYVRDNSACQLLTAVGRPPDGFLGMGFLRYYEVTLDYPGARACFVDLRQYMGRTTRRPEPDFSCVRIKYPNLYVVVSTELNDRGPYQFLLDTGAQRTTVSPAVAADLGLVKGMAGTAHGIDDALPAYLSEVASVKVGTQRVERLPVAVVDCQRTSKATGMEIDGYLGHNFLQQFAVRVNVLELYLGLARAVSKS